MGGPGSWRAWQSAVRPAVESILGNSLTSATPRPVTLQSTPPWRAAKSLRDLSSSGKRRADPTHLVSSYPNDENIRKEIKDRKSELDKSGIQQYPRIKQVDNEVSVQDFNSRFDFLKPGEKDADSGHVQLAGRVTSIRKSGSKLAFVDICEEPGHHKVQLMLNLGQMGPVERQTFSNHIKLISRGDVVSAKGTATRTASGELSLIANSLPQILSPCLHRMPLTSHQSQTANETDIDILNRHVEMLIDPSVISTIVARSKLIDTMHEFFRSQHFLHVQTPILAGAAGGATARPFETIATEFPDRKLSLRIAPELWLKRLIIGGLFRVYEIGPSFRNEGLDQTHNPEFTTCEFYAAYHTLPQLQSLTEDLLRSVSATIHSLNDSFLKPPAQQMFNGTFSCIDFIPALNTALDTPLPNLASSDAHSAIINIFKSRSLPLPARPTLPRLLDKLCSTYLESQTLDKPTWIINTPECLSPLAKSFIHPDCPNNQAVAARAELFIHGREIVNCYEEENSPFEQRRKFVDQQRHGKISTDGDGNTLPQTIEDDESHPVDEEYLRALEWGLPPTGGWGCGIDRLVMLFTGKNKIGDVLSFGNLRAVTRRAEKK